MREGFKSGLIMNLFSTYMSKNQDAEIKRKGPRGRKGKTQR